MEGKNNKLLEDIGKKLDALIILNLYEDLSGEDKLNLIKHSIGIKPLAKLLNKDASNFRKSLKNPKSKDKK